MSTTSPTPNVNTGFLLLMLGQITSLKSKEDFSKKIKSLFDVIPKEVPYLIEIENQSENTKNLERKKVIDNKLRASWYELWSTNTYDKAHEPYFQKHYPQLTQWERFNLLKIIKKHNLDDLFITSNTIRKNTNKKSIISNTTPEVRNNLKVEVKKIDELAIALKSYELNKSGLLSAYLKKNDNITTKQAERILNKINDCKSYYRPQLKIIASVFEKSDIDYRSYAAYSLLENFIFFTPKDYQIVATALNNNFKKNPINEENRIENRFYRSDEIEKNITPLVIMVEGFAAISSIQSTYNEDRDEDIETIIYDKKEFSNFCQNLNWSFSQGLLPHTEQQLLKNKTYQDKISFYKNNVSRAILEILGSKANMRTVSRKYSMSWICGFEENKHFHETLHTMHQQVLFQAATEGKTPREATVKRTFKL